MRNQWRRHPVHGHMLLGPIYQASDGNAYRTVVTSLLQANAEIEASAKLWANQTLRLHVNAGCGQLAVDEHRVHDINPAFVPIDGRRVPKHIRAAFTKVLS